MVNISDLPVELLLAIFSSIGDIPNTSLYTDKERQRDLFNFALVTKSFRAPAEHLLYSGNVTLRNAGRTEIFARTLRDRPDLASQVTTMCAVTSVGAASSPLSIIEVLQGPAAQNIAKVALSEDIFATDSQTGRRLHAALSAMTQMREFEWRGLQGWYISCERVIELVSRWPNLKSLSIGEHKEVRPGDSLIIPDVDPGGVRAQCQLGYLKLPLCVASWHQLERLASSTCALRTLELCVVPSDVLALWSGEPEFEQPLIGVCLLRRLLATCTSVTLRTCRGARIQLALWFEATPHLRHFCLEQPMDESHQDLQPITFLPSKLETITLIGRRSPHLDQLIKLIDETGPGSLKSVTIFGHHPTDAWLNPCKTVCKHAGVECMIKPFVPGR